MYLLLGAIQLLLPIALVGWLAFAPLGSAIGLWVQIAMTGLVLLALAWAGMWLLPPWWTPYLFGVLWIGAIAVALRRNSTVRPAWPTGWTQGIGFAVLDRPESDHELILAPGRAKMLPISRLSS